MKNYRTAHVAIADCCRRAPMSGGTFFAPAPARHWTDHPAIDWIGAVALGLCACAVVLHAFGAL